MSEVEKKETYRPLPSNLEIRLSSIDGNGLFSKENVKSGTEFGITHVRDSRFQDGHIRTPLGGFFNHSDDPNCEAYIDCDFIKLRAIKDIAKDEELLATYWLYNMG
jgi:hypothetical protein